MTFVKETQIAKGNNKKSNKIFLFLCSVFNSPVLATGLVVVMYPAQESTIKTETGLCLAKDKVILDSLLLTTSKLRY